MIVYVKWEVNSAAYGLVWGAATHGIDRFWLEEIPPNIYAIVMRDPGPGSVILELYNTMICPKKKKKE